MRAFVIFKSTQVETLSRFCARRFLSNAWGGSNACRRALCRGRLQLCRGFDANWRGRLLCRGGAGLFERGYVMVRVGFQRGDVTVLSFRKSENERRPTG